MAEQTKISFPVYDGNVCQQWRAKCEQYFMLEEENRSADEVSRGKRRIIVAEKSKTW